METDYNNIYLKQSNKSRLRRIPFYKELASHINQNDMVLDLGCGNGMLPIFSKFKKYKGIDFSEIAIEQAKRFCKTAKFICGDVITFIKKEKYTLVVLTEFLEHVDNDIEIITLIKKGSNVLISVPFDEPIINDRPKGYPTHKRSYTIQSFKSRYKDIKFEKIYIFNTWIIALGIKI